MCEPIPARACFRGTHGEESVRLHAVALHGGCYLGACERFYEGLRQVRLFSLAVKASRIDRDLLQVGRQRSDELYAGRLNEFADLLKANLRFAGPETMETKIFGRLTAWQNWIFTRPNAVGEKGALTSYGSQSRPEFDFGRT